MELILLLGAILLVGIVYYFLCSVIYLALTSRPIAASLGMCWKLALANIIGAPLFGFGGILLATLWFNKTLSELPNYKQVQDIIVGVVLSLAGTALLFVVTMSMAWGILG